jgi:TonB-linked SusC/RagA family outer membrane protein
MRMLLLRAATASTLLVVPLALHAQTREITGRVTSRDTQEPLNNVEIVLVGQSARLGTYTNDQGRYRLVVNGGDATLRLRRLGYRARTVPAPSTQPTLDITLDRDVLELGSVVVTGQATTVERRNAATAVSTVSTDELVKVPSVSIEDALQGKVVGAKIQMNSGAPGGGGQIQIRGTSSILGNAEPLIVVDGVIVSNATVNVAGINSITRSSGSGANATTDNEINRLGDINPDDIDHLDVLKGAAASAIYGAKATNGVIVITTKRGRVGQTSVHVTQRAGVYSPLRLLGSRHFPDAASALKADGGGSLAAAAVNGACNPTCPYFDYQKDFYSSRTPSYETNVALTGGSDATRYYASVGDKFDDGTMINTGARKQTLRMNLDQTLASRLTSQVSATVLRTFAQRGISNNDNTYTSPIYLFAYSPAIIPLNVHDANGNFVHDPFAGGGATASNPFETLNDVQANEDTYRGMASMRLLYTALNSDNHTLTFSAIGGADWFNQEDQIYSPNFLQFEPNDGFLGTAVQGQGVSRQSNGSLNVVWGAKVPRFGSAFETSAGVQLENRSLNQYSVRARGLVPGVTDINQGTQDATQIKTAVHDRAYYVTEQLLALDEKFLIMGGARAERSSVNGDVSKYYFFPRGSASYRIVEPLRGVNEVKLRAAIGTSGNQPRYGDRDPTLNTLGIVGGQNALGVAATLGNPAIKPERMREQELGIDATFLNQRLGLELTRFDRHITDLLLTAPLPPTSGITNLVINGGHVTSKGWELAGTIEPIRSQQFDWTSHTSFYAVRGHVVSLPVPAFVVPNSGFGAAYGRARISPGFSSTAIWGNRQRPNGTTVDSVVGDATPKFTMQFGNDFRWNRIVVSALVDWRNGGQVSDLTRNLFDEGFNSWDYDKPSPDPSVGATLGAYRYNSWKGGQNSLAYIESGSYTALREVSLTYDVPNRFFSMLSGRVSQVRFSLTGRNLFLWTKYWGMDPDAAQFGNQAVRINVDHSPYPLSRSFFLSIDVGT